jgi:para-aminobenzoate synthetase component 1
VLNWLRPFNTFCFLDNHAYTSKLGSVECLVAAGVKRSISASSGNALEQLQRFIDQQESYLFGHLGYDLKNEIEGLSSVHSNGIGFADMYFFEPEVVINLSASHIEIDATDPEKIFEQIQQCSAEKNAATGNSIELKSRFTKEEYCKTIERIKSHIQRGDCYELNFCQEFYNEQVTVDPFSLFGKLMDLSPNPFSALYRVQDDWLLCASPERFLKKTGSALYSQPIKGTARRILDNAKADAEISKALYESVKDRSENVMVVDLVRNDLSRVCKTGTVEVEELFGLYSFPQVHQLISTVKGELSDSYNFSDIMHSLFPMGSMTGAPKKRVMELIEEVEKTKRGLYSGALGYISPDGDFDFNVVIRSLFYNSHSGYLSCQVGGGITHYSKAEQEWEECLIKAKAILKVLSASA